MKAVWAFRAGNFTVDRNSEWSFSFKFNGLTDLCAQLEKEKLQGLVGKLALVAHGDLGGQIKLDRILTPSTITSFSGELTALNQFLTPDGRLIFLSCIAGMGPEGSDLLKAISSYIPGRIVIGFSEYGAMLGLSSPGQVYEAPGGGNYASGGGPPASFFKGKPKLTEESIYAKWAQNGTIVRIPKDEQRRNKQYRCAMPTCSGHSSLADRCVPLAPAASPKSLRAPAR